MRPKAQALLSAVGLTDITRGRRTTTLRHVEERLRQTLCSAADSVEAQPPSLHWHTRVVALTPGPDHVLATLQADDGTQHIVRARHVVDATGVSRKVARTDHLHRGDVLVVGRSNLSIFSEVLLTAASLSGLILAINALAK